MSTPTIQTDLITIRTEQHREVNEMFSPSAPSEGAALAALAPGVGLVDRLRDTLSGRGR
ncbi:MAG: hypothetical protein ACRDTE_00225 [Pseudonocardiaceae bacterium]